MESENKTWHVNVEEDPETGDAMIQFPPEMLEELGWQAGDKLYWHDNKDGTWSLYKKQPDSENKQ